LASQRDDLTTSSVAEVMRRHRQRLAARATLLVLPTQKHTTMPSRRKPKATSTTVKLAELAFATPQVMAHRLTRMALAGPVLSQRDHKEFSGMVQEKQMAFVQSWMAMSAETVRVQQSLFMHWLSPARMLTPWSASSGAAATSVLQGAALRIAAKGIAPVHKKAVSNAKRLRKVTLT
jgi:hypothetical protein